MYLNDKLNSRKLCVNQLAGIFYITTDAYKIYE